MNRIARIGRLAGFLGAVMCASAASAEVVVYDNSVGTFQWTTSVSAQFEDPFYGKFLDITKPPTQSGERLPGTFGRWLSPNTSSSDPTIRSIVGEGNAQVARLNYWINVEWNGTTIGILPIREYVFGESVSTEADWQFWCPYFFHLPFSADYSKGTPFISPLAYIGVKRVVDGQTNFGWILLKDYRYPVMWAYETQIDVAIEIPIPGPGILACALPMVGLLTRRHRSSRMPTM